MEEGTEEEQYEEEGVEEEEGWKSQRKGMKEGEEEEAMGRKEKRR